MSSVNYKNKNVGEREWQYNWQHVVFVTNKRRRNFRKEYNRAVARTAIEEAAHTYGIIIKEFSFGEDFAHVHMEVSIPNTMSISYAVQLLKGYSSYKVFKEMPRHRLRYFKGHFWTAGYSNGSVGPRDENTLQNYIRKQDISGQLHLAI